MKKLILITLLIPLLFGCNNNKQEYEALRVRYDSLLAIGYTKDTAVLGYLESFNAIQANLDEIKRAEMLITKTATDSEGTSGNVQEQINRDINMIYELLQQNKKTIADLRTQLKKSNANVSSLEEMINRITQQVEDKDVEIAQLRNRLEEMNYQIDLLNSNVESLTAEGQAKSQIISAQTEELNTAYYVMGTKKELRDHNIITMEGGFAGIGRNKTMKKDFNQDYFTRVDITRLTSIPVMHKKATIVTVHPSQSYTIYGDKKVDSIVINKPTDFWSASKYLVIIID